MRRATNLNRQKSNLVACLFVIFLIVMNAKPTQARETLDGAALSSSCSNDAPPIITERLCVRVALHEVSRMLDTGLDKETLGLLVALCEAGVNPEALAHGIRELHRVSETAASASKSAQME